MRSKSRGQAMVETAITMPLFVFVILGGLQLALAHQARLMNKYAAYKAARAGALFHARKARMEKAAAVVMIPMISHSSGGIDLFYKSRSMGDYALSSGFARFNIYTSGLKIVRINICSPTKQDEATRFFGSPGSAPWSGNGYGWPAAYADPNSGPDPGTWGFDWPESFVATGGSSALGDQQNGFERTRLAIESVFNYRMPIPFANMMIFTIFNGTQTQGLGWVTRTNSNIVPMTPFNVGVQHGEQSDIALRMVAANGGQYFLPIRSTYSMRMQSDLYPSGNDLPAKNECLYPNARQH
jgi:hypothetical protein